MGITYLPDHIMNEVVLLQDHKVSPNDSKTHNQIQQL